MLVYPSGVDVSSSALRFLSAKLRQRRRELGTRWRRLSALWQRESLFDEQGLLRVRGVIVQG